MVVKFLVKLFWLLQVARQIPDIPGLRQYAITSTQALDLDNLPDRIIVYGAGYIALEFAGIFNGFGSEVHLVYRGDLPLRGFDDDIRQHMAEALANRGIHIHHGETVTAVRQIKNDWL